MAEIHNVNCRLEAGGERLSEATWLTQHRHLFVSGQGVAGIAEDAVAG